MGVLMRKWWDHFVDNWYEPGLVAIAIWSYYNLTIVKVANAIAIVYIGG